jgi:hypothetical protein
MLNEMTMCVMNMLFRGSGRGPFQYNTPTFSING